MPRYFFHTRNGHHLEDDEGTELPNLDAAKANAVGYLGEMVRGQPDTLWGTGDFSVIVTDEDRLVLFRLDLIATMSAGASKGAKYG